MRKATSLVILLATLALVFAACGGSDSGSAPSEQPKVAAGSVAVVGTQQITQAEFDAVYNYAIKQGVASGQTAPEKGSAEETTLKQQVMQSLVQNAEIAQEATAKKIKVDPKKVDEDLKAFKLQCCEDNPAKYQKYLKEQGLTEAELTAQFELRQQAEGLFDDVTKGVKVTAEEAQKQFDKDEKTKYTTTQARKVAHILVDVAPKGKGTAADCTKAAKVLKEVQANPKDWKALVKKYSADPGSKDTGGEYDITDDENWDADFRMGAFGLADTGDITDPPVQSQFGCHIIKALGPITPATVKAFDEVKQQIIDELTQAKKDEVATKWLEGVQKSYESKTTFAKGYSMPPAQTTSTATTTG